MNRATVWLSIGFCAVCSFLPLEAEEDVKRQPYSVLFVGELESARAKEYVSFLEQTFRETRTVERTTFRPEAARGVDVVLVDWPQGSGAFPPESCPLGARESWRKPTVLLGSAGLQVAVAWELIGGSG